MRAGTIFALRVSHHSQTPGRQEASNTAVLQLWYFDYLTPVSSLLSGWDDATCRHRLHRSVSNICGSENAVNSCLLPLTMDMSSLWQEYEDLASADWCSEVFELCEHLECITLHVMRWSSFLVECLFVHTSTNDSQCSSSQVYQLSSLWCCKVLHLCQSSICTRRPDLITIFNVNCHDVRTSSFKNMSLEIRLKKCKMQNQDSNPGEKMVPRMVASSGYSTAPIAESDGDRKDPRGGPRTGLAEAGGEPKLNVASHNCQPATWRLRKIQCISRITGAHRLGLAESL